MGRAPLTAGLVIALVLALALPAVAPAANPRGPEARTARYFAAIRTDEPKLRAFLKAMPKGADLHNHLSGAVPTETLIGYAIDDGLCIDTLTLTAMFAPATPGEACPVGQRPAADARSDPALFEQIVRAWSMEGFQPGVESGHDHFFATFGKFGAATGDKGEMLAAVAQINARQHVHYLETLVSRQSSAVRDLAAKVGFNEDFAATRARLLAGGMAQIIAAATAETDADMTRYRTLLHCATPSQADAACAMQTRFDYQVGRATKPEIVFTNLLLGFELQRSDSRYVGVNLVQPEDDPVALRDYTLQMRMIRYLRSVYPRAHVTLHAGELVAGLVPAADLRSHVREAVEIAGADRIGHGVDVLGETNAAGLLATMARRKVLVEVPLTSNRQILGVFGAKHPFMRYRAAGVPVALATDDPAVSRIDLTHEYEYATGEYGLGYRTLKRLSRTSLEYSFLPGKSLWRARGDHHVRAACASDTLGEPLPGRACSALLRASVKAATQWRLERAIRHFELRRRGLHG
jgi:adenosine deaminase